MLTVLTAFFTFAPQLLESRAPEFSKRIPTWQSIYAAFGLELEEGAKACTLPLAVSFIDVGQGDCIFISSKDCKILIDTGEEGNEERILSHLAMYGTDRLDLFVITHPHSDHLGSAEEILEKMPIDKLLVTRESSNAESEAEFWAQRELLSLAKQRDITVQTAKRGDTLSFGDVKLEILSPIYDAENVNDMSIVIKLTFGETGFLFTGDAESFAEYRLLGKDYEQGSKTLQADVLKVAHHGSNTSSCEDFVAAVNPAVAVIMCATDNDYGHPHAKTLRTLYKYGVKICRTDTDGTTVIGSDGKTVILQ